MKITTVLTLVGLMAVPFLTAQTVTPTPIVVQAAKPSTTITTSTVASAAASPSLQEAMKSLQEIKAKNEETLNKQRAAIEKLDEVEKAAQQLKIYSKRT